MIGLVIRICKQMKNDRRSLGMMFVIPLVIITFLYFLLGNESANINVSLIGANDKITEAFEEAEDITVVECSDSDSVEQLLKDGKTDAIVDFTDGVKIDLLENNSTYLSKVQSAIKDVQEEVLHQGTMKTEYVYGNNLDTTFEKLSYVLIGVICFFLVFLISGVSFVRERTMGTLERFMLTPIKRAQVVLGYTIGFGIFGTVQSIITLLFVHYVLGISYAGSIFLGVLIMVLLAFSAVSIGAFVSIFANSEFQVIQFIPIVIIPQIFYSGLLSLNGLPLHLDKLEYVMPVYYGCTALKKVLINGQGFADIGNYIALLIAFIFVFFILNVISLKKYRAV